MQLWAEDKYYSQIREGGKQNKRWAHWSVGINPKAGEKEKKTKMPTPPSQTVSQSAQRRAGLLGDSRICVVIWHLQLPIKAEVTFEHLLYPSCITNHSKGGFWSWNKQDVVFLAESKDSFWGLGSSALRQARLTNSATCLCCLLLSPVPCNKKCRLFNASIHWLTNRLYARLAQTASSMCALCYLCWWMCL